MLTKMQVEDIMRRATVCRLGLLKGDTPYVVPLCFGYRDDTLYFHSSPKSQKLDLIRHHPRVGFEMDILAAPLPAPAACNWSMRYQSVIGSGLASIIEGMKEKRRALDMIMAHYARGAYEFPDPKVAITAVFKVDIDSMTGKQSKIDADD